MMRSLHTTRGAHGSRRSAAVQILSLLLLVVTTACDSIIGIEESPSRVLAHDAEQPGNAPLLVAGAINEFECAFGRYTVMAGLLGNELRWSSSSPWGLEVDLRNMDPASGLYGLYTCASGLSVYKPLSTARWMADNTLLLLDGWTDEQVPDRTELIATTATYSGYSYILMGEGMCTAAFDEGPEMGPDSIFLRAVARFERAIAAGNSVGNDDVVNLARVGQARALLNLGQHDEAAAVAAQVADGFVAHAVYDNTIGTRSNYVYSTIQLNRGMSVDAPYRTVTFNGVPDSRVQVQESGLGADNETPLFVPLKYDSQLSDIRLASWIEAQLIIAEARGGQEAVDIINMLHDRAGLPHFASDDPAEIQRQIQYERQAEFFLESQHLGDLRRYDLPLYPAPGEEYVGTGTGIYGDQRCFPLPDSERSNNPTM